VRERELVGQMLQRRVSGLLVVPTAGDHSWLAGSGTPVVLVDRAAEGLSADVVGIDDRTAAAQAVTHLIGHGHRRIGYVGDLPEIPTSAARLAGYRDAMAAAGLEVDESLVRADCRDSRSAAVETADLLAADRAPTAVFSAATRCSLGVVPALHAAGRTDVALVGFGDFAMADALVPAVTVVDHPARAVGLAAARRLARRLSEPNLPAETMHVPFRLVARGSGELTVST
jgi:LacI family transcriptional regulator